MCDSIPILPEIFILQSWIFFKLRTEIITLKILGFFSVKIFSHLEMVEMQIFQ